MNSAGSERLSPGLKKLSFCLLVLAGLAAAGCLNVAIKDTSGPKAPSRDEESFAEFLDVPYPATMTLEKDNTFTYSRRDILAGVVTVVGRMTVDELADYYDNHLPSYGWSPLAEAQNIKLVSTWTKGGKVLTVVATPIIMAIGGNLRVELWVAPPHTKGDLGNRLRYQNSESGQKPYSTKPIRNKNGSFDEENI
ncbi:MAG: hypothetical protein LBT47_00920 [Deltaproteobacteria bacterium]|jgi:hypothetical protein|nr:hypothetical protein [Deltaproteobacteria bacterium]